MLSLVPLLLAPSSIPTPEPVLLPTSALHARIPDSADRPGFSYTYIEANYTWLDSDAGGDTLDGVDLTGSLELPANFFVQATAWSLSGDVDLDRYRLGAGWHFGLGKLIDGYGMLSYVQDEFSSGVSDEDGVTGDVGVRFMMLPKLELDGYVEWADVESSETGLGLGARWYLTERLSVGANALIIDSGDHYNGGVRFQF